MAAPLVGNRRSRQPGPSEVGVPVGNRRNCNTKSRRFCSEVGNRRRFEPLFERETAFQVGNRRFGHAVLWITDVFSVYYPPSEGCAPVYHPLDSVYHPPVSVYYPPESVYHPPGMCRKWLPRFAFLALSTAYIFCICFKSYKNASCRCSPPLGVRFAPPAGSSGLRPPPALRAPHPASPEGCALSALRAFTLLSRRLRRNATKRHQRSHANHPAPSLRPYLLSNEGAFPSSKGIGKRQIGPSSTPKRLRRGVGASFSNLASQRLH